ncbi:LPS-assembly protein LptD [Vreelandella boliviensis]|uniref:LPS-assembly protein LptD n=1 Tax=Vreelandella boliviensis LC1 TaxID=1072583 RepID=A0A265E163_9GAMM|nr:LPS-assembly protein LptD [Halomonas boliviensis]EHJ92745.1 LPS-assembly protein lptD [Halomonas boliviensis LC1]OZT75270.1 LPS-assembly protein LptD [Halomonas boliviensis LC1]
MGKRFSRTLPVAHTLMGSLLAGASFTAVAQGEALSAEALDWQPWGKEEAANQLCRGRYVMPSYRLPAEDNPETLSLEASDVDYAANGEALLRGDVVLRRGNEELEAERVFLPADRQQIDAEGNIAIRDGLVLVRGEQAMLRLNEDRATLGNSHYVLYEQHLRGQARQLEQTGESEYRLKDASFTTCDPGANSWQLVSSDIRLNQAEGFGTARHARLQVKDVPVFYWPWLRFPIDDRRHTGLLTPSIGLSADGFDYTQPFYWNIAPNRDATITPRWMSDHGLLMNGEYRYLFEESAGIVEGGYLSSDNGGSGGGANRFEGEDRWYVDARHAGRVNERSNYSLRYGAASDGRYFDDFGGEFGDSDRASMGRLAQVDYRGERWQLDARAQGFQRLEYPLNDSDKPFYRLPSLSANANWQLGNGFYSQWRSNATYFWRDVNEQRVIEREAATGSRVHLTPALGWRFERPWGYLEPRTELWHTDYQLDYGERDTQRSDSPSRSIAVTSVDSGLAFDRELSLGGRDYRQTLEPRLNYAYVPRTNQSELPVFDSRERAFSWNQLWSAQRFSGADRVGDLNRLSYGVQSRLLEDASGRDRLSFGVGQSVYFDDRRIDIEGDADTLPSRTDGERYYQATRDKSPLVTRIDWQISDRWSTGYDWLYDDNLDRTERSSLDVRYRHPQGHVVNLGYRWEIQNFDPGVEASDDSFRNYDREEWDLSFAWKASPQIDLIGRYIHDQTNDRSLEQLAGVQWSDCCYGLQLVWREWVDDNDNARIDDDFNDRGLFLRFVFRGLGGVGQEADSYFEQTIPGYRPTAL